MIHLKLNDKYELLALHRTLMEAKFHPEPHLVPGCQGSPLVARIANLVCDKLIELERKSGNTKAANDWVEWRKSDLNRREAKLLVKRICEMKDWISLSREQKIEFISDFMAPLVLSQESYDELLQNHR